MGPGPGPKAAVGQPAPKFQATTLAGKTVSFPADYAGKLVLVDFWATWCGPCRAEIPHLREAQAQFGEKGLTILGVSLDTGPNSKVSRFVEENEMSWNQIIEDGKRIAEAYGVSAIPAAFLVDGDTGQILSAGDAVRGSALKATVAKNLSHFGANFP